MIALLRGEVCEIGLDSVILDVNGVGYRVFAAPATLASLRHGQTATLATSLVVREDAMTLFGFLHVEERDMYETLQTVSGVGPKLALAMLAVHSPEDLRLAVQEEDVKTLQRVPGVGPKSAKRLVLELQGKLGEPMSPAGASTPQGASSPASTDVVNALVGLGWNLKAATDAVDAITGARDAPTDSAGLLRAALAHLGGGQRG